MLTPGPIALKRAIKRTAGLASIALSPLASPEQPAACILMYHRIAAIDFIDPRVDDWNVPPNVFDRQLQALSTIAEVVPLHTLRDRLKRGDAHRTDRPLACITIDDGYAGACTCAVPILQRYAMPATLFVPTAFVDTETPLPFDRWAQRNRTRTPPETWRAARWRDLERAVATGLVSLGSHSHHHLSGGSCDAARLTEEAEHSRDCLRAHFGPAHARTYAYPYGNSRLGDVPDPYESAVRTAGYELAVTTDPGLAGATSNAFRLPRLEVHQLDSVSVLRAKLHGSVMPYRVIDHLRRPA